MKPQGLVPNTQSLTFHRTIEKHSPITVSKFSTLRAAAEQAPGTGKKQQVAAATKARELAMACEGPEVPNLQRDHTTKYPNQTPA